jgi:hypothetical protein
MLKGPIGTHRREAFGGNVATIVEVFSHRFHGA